MRNSKSLLKSGEPLFKIVVEIASFFGGDICLTTNKKTTQHTQRRKKTDTLQHTATHCNTLQHIAATNTPIKLRQNLLNMKDRLFDSQADVPPQIHDSF